jgi:hypothetical protein
MVQAQDYAYSGQCSVSSSSPGVDHQLHRTFRARYARNADGDHWAIVGYDYWYNVESPLSWGPHSDERIDVTSGLVSGPSPWHSPDDHTSNVAWVHEDGWKASTNRGHTAIKAHAWFDVPSQNDPECDAYTAAF